MSETTRAPRALSTPIAAVTAGLAGFAVMSLELAAVRILAPHFGDSSYVWTNVIGVILLALAAGAFLGGRLADRPSASGADPGPRRLAVLFATAGTLAIVIPWTAGWLGDAMLPADLALDRAMSALVLGSLAATLCVFAPPVFAMGAITPVLVATLARSRGEVGRASGIVAAWSTLGSLAGTFATTHLLVPGIGSRATIWVAAGALFACAALCARRPAVLAVLLAPLGAAALTDGPLRAPVGDDRLEAEVESAYQYLQVVRSDVGDRVSTQLKINEGLDSFHSVALEGTPFTNGLYYDYHAPIPFLAGDGVRPPFLRALSLGAAAGTFERVLAATHPGIVVDSVELDPAVVELGREHFGAFDNDGTVYAGLDARVFVDRSSETYHAIIVDAYERQIYIPAHVASFEFFRAAQRRLTPGGVVSVNVGGLSIEDPVVTVVAGTMAEVFGEAWAFRIPRSRNFVIAARNGHRLDPAALAEIEVEGLGSVLEAMAQPAAWTVIQRGGPVLTDDRPFLDRLQDRALSQEFSPDPWTMAGERDPLEVGTLAAGSLGQRDFVGARRFLTSAAQPTGYLRLLAGDCRWELRDLPGALVEYREAERLGVDAAQRAALAGRISGAEAELEQIQRADEAASRNGMIALAAGLALLAAFAVCVALQTRGTPAAISA